MQMSDIIFSLLWDLVIILGFILIVWYNFFGYKIRRNKLEQRCTVSVQATIIDYYRSSRKRRKTLYFPVYKYTYNGITYRVRGRYARRPSNITREDTEFKKENPNIPYNYHMNGTFALKINPNKPQEILG